MTRHEESPERPPRRPIACPSCATFLGPQDADCPTCGHRLAAGPESTRPTKRRRKRHVRGVYDERQAQEIRRIPGVTPARARALLEAGYTALWKIKRARLDELAAIPEIGREGAREILSSLRFVLQFPQRRSKEAVLDEEFQCPLCGCVTSAFSPGCVDCRASFEEEEMDEELRASLLRDGNQGLLAFYDLHLMDDPEDADLLYARGLLLEGMGLHGEALASLNRAAAGKTTNRRIALARTRILAKAQGEPEAAEQLRSTLREVVDTAALDQEIADFQRSVGDRPLTCGVCAEPLPPGSSACSACGTAAISPPPPLRPTRKGTSEIDELDFLLDELEESVVRKKGSSDRAAVEERLLSALGKDLSPPSPEPASPGLPEARHVSTPTGFRTGSLLRGALRGRPRGAVNGVVNGQGRVNGFINGRGRVNGFVNGKGYVNGSGLTLIQLPRTPHRIAYSILGIVLVTSALLLGAIFFPVTGPQPPILIDGAFDDWTAVPYLDAATTSSDSNVKIARYAALLDRETLYLYASTSGTTFGDGVGYDGIFFLIDADGDGSTGYRFAGLGADYVLETYGGNGTLAASRVYSFPRDAEMNWSRRQVGPSASAAASPMGVEARLSILDLVPFSDLGFRIAVYADNFEGASSQGEALLAWPPGAIRIEASSLTTILGSGPTELLEVRVASLGLTSEAETWTVSGFQLAATPGVITSLSAESVNLTRGQPTVSIRVSVQAPGLLPGDLVEVDVLGASGSRPISVVGGPIRAYVLTPLASKRIDGLFADWIADAVGDADPGRINNSNVDIVRYGAAANGTAAYFHVQVAGSLLAGALPQRFVPIPPGQGSGGGPRPGGAEPRRTGEDVLLVYVDVNASDPRGMPVGGIFADYLVEIRGQGGRITSRTLSAWSDGWSRVPGSPVPAAKDTTSIEGSLPLPPTNEEVRMVFAMTDWSGIGDITDPLTAAVLPATAPPQLAPPIEIHAPEFEIVAMPVLGVILIGFAVGRRRRHGFQGNAL